MKYIKILNPYLIFRVVLGIVFIYASYHKILNPAEFSENIHNYHVIPVELENIAALVIPWLELVVGVFLIFGVFLDGSLIITICLYVLFIVMLTQAVWRGIDVHCGCFKSAADAQVTDFRLELIKQIILDCILVLMAFFVKIKEKTKYLV